MPGGVSPGDGSASRAGRAGRLVAAIIAAAIVMGAALTPAPACAARSRPRGAAASLFHREKFEFSWKTADEIRDFLASLPDRAPELIRRIPRYAGQQSLIASALVAFVMIAFVSGLFVRRRFTSWAKAQLMPLAEGLPEAATPWFSAVVSVAAAVAVPLTLWMLWEFVAAITNFKGPGFLIVGIVLPAWTIYVLVTRGARELLTRQLVGIPSEDGRYLFRVGRLLLIYAVALIVVLKSALALGAPRDVIALCRWFFRLTLIVLLAFVFVRRRAIMSLFPDLPNRMYRGFVRAFHRLYPGIYALTMITALLQWAGFRVLADSIWVRTWAVMGVFVGAVILHHMLRVGLRGMILGAGPQTEGAWDFYRSAARLLDYLVFIAAADILLHITGVWRPVISFLGVPFADVGERPLSLLILIEAALIVAGFVFSATLLRDCLEYQIYPRFHVDAGVAHAINTFLVYTLTIIGVIAAMEAVGLGLGTITLFAGAFGIGLGFGLQSMANNLASGLTLIFSRALRKGDVVTVGDTIGVIQEVGIRATRMRTRDDVEYLVPNSEFVSGKVVNWTRSSPYTRLHVPLGVSYDADPERVREILESVAARAPNVEQSPPPEVWFSGFGESSLNFELLVWINIRTVQRHKVASDLYFAIFNAFKEAGIEIPFPQRDLHIRSADGLLALDRKRGGDPSR